MRRLILLATIALGLVARTCPPSNRSHVGNGVVDEAAAEDCDLFAADGDTRCGQPGEVRQCRFVCGDRRCKVPRGLGLRQRRRLPAGRR